MDKKPRREAFFEDSDWKRIEPVDDITVGEALCAIIGALSFLGVVAVFLVLR